MSKTVIVDYENNLIVADGITKRLPIITTCDHAFGVLTWNGTSGAMTYADGGMVPIVDPAIVQPFLSAFEIEPPQLAPEQIGAARQMDPIDPDWPALVQRHAGLVIAINALIVATVAAIVDVGKAKNDAAKAQKKAFQLHMNAVRKTQGTPEVIYDD